MSLEKDKFLLFVYGTLKTGEPNHFYMTDTVDNGKATLLGIGETINRYPLVVATHNHLPFLLLEEGKGENVEGEIWEVDRRMFEWLDEFESHPDFYRRELAKIKVKDGEFETGGQVMRQNDVCQCWTYFLSTHKPEMLELHMLKSYSSCSPDHLPYNTGEEMTSLDDL